MTAMRSELQGTKWTNRGTARAFRRGALACGLWMDGVRPLGSAQYCGAAGAGAHGNRDCFNIADGDDVADVADVPAALCCRCCA
ncbi:hypothetical protein NW759_009282 [Fusarium solani]|nr:hypothetical protein NW759_009282 [Fusarium solani]